MTRKHVHEETFPVSPDDLFRILIQPSAIRAWWGASRAIVLPEEAGAWAATWGDDEDEPDYTTIATIREITPGVRLVLDNYRYRAKDGGLPFEADFVTEFSVTRAPEGATLKVIQDGFPRENSSREADEFYEGCRIGWSNTFDGIRRYLSPAE